MKVSAEKIRSRKHPKSPLRAFHFAQICRYFCCALTHLNKHPSSTRRLRLKLQSARELIIVAAEGCTCHIPGLQTSIVDPLRIQYKYAASQEVCLCTTQYWYWSMSYNNVFSSQLVSSDIVILQSQREALLLCPAIGDFKY